MSKITMRPALFAVLLGALPVVAAAQVPGVKAPSLGLTLGVKVNTLGFGPEVGYSILPKLAIKVGANFASLNRSDVDVSDVNFNAVELKFQSFNAMLDLQALGPIHLDAGLIHNGNKLSLTGTPTSNVTLGSTTYTPGQVGSITGTVDFKKWAPYLGMDLVMGGRVAFLMTLGAMLQGTPQLGYTATPGPSITGPALINFTTQVAAEKAQAQADLDGRSYLKTWPVVGFGLRVKI